MFATLLFWYTGVLDLTSVHIALHLFSSFPSHLHRTARSLVYPLHYGYTILIEGVGEFGNYHWGREFEE